MKRETFKIASVRLNDPHVTGYIVGPFGIDRDRDTLGIYREWTITHLRTGLTLGLYLPTRAAAVRVAEALVPLTNWNRGRWNTSAAESRSRFYPEAADAFRTVIRKLKLTPPFGFPMKRKAAR